MIRAFLSPCLSITAGLGQALGWPAVHGGRFGNYRLQPHPHGKCDESLVLFLPAHQTIPRLTGPAQTGRGSVLHRSPWMTMRRAETMAGVENTRSVAPPPRRPASALPRVSESLH